MKEGQSLSDLPYELLRGILAGSGGQGVALASCCCKRMKQVADQLMQQPIFCSAMSTKQDLNEAIKDATRRAITGSWGKVDFALIFVANYELPKKYTHPGDVSHAVDMLKEVLGKDIPIVGCACSGIMGTGPDSLPVEVDPACRTPWGRRAARMLLQRGQAQPPTRGVSILLGKMPAGCAVRAFASATEPTTVTNPWPDFEEALALTSSQRTQLATELAAAAQTTLSATVASKTPATTAWVIATATDGSASSATVAAATSLSAVAMGNSTVAATQGPFHSGYGDVKAQLDPQLCLMLYHDSLHVSDDMQLALDWMKAHHPGMHLVGGVSSGAQTLLYSAGSVNRLASEPPVFPQYVGLLLCSASSGTAESATLAADAQSNSATAATRPATIVKHRAADRGSLSRSAVVNDKLDSRRLLSVAALSAYGLAAVPGCAVYTNVVAQLSHMHGDTCRLHITSATLATGTATQSVSTSNARLAEAVSPSSGGSSEPAALPAAADVEGKQLHGSSSTAAMLARGEAVECEQHLHSMQDPVAHSVTDPNPAVERASMASGVQQLIEEVKSITRWDVDGLMLGLWRCPAGSVPARFTGLEDQMVAVSLASFEDDYESGSVAFEVALMESEAEASRQPLTNHDIWRDGPGTRLCLQLLHHSAQGSVDLVNLGLARMKQQLLCPARPVATVGANAAGSMSDCYAAAAASAASVGARSGSQGLAVFSCTGRGQALYCRRPDLCKASSCDLNVSCDPSAYGAVGEAALVDNAFQQGIPFAGVFCDGELGPPVRDCCIGWAADDCSSVSMPQAYTSMFAGFACCGDQR